MNPLVKTAVAIATQAEVPTGLMGEPGIGKTAFIKELGKALDIEVVPFYGSCRTPEDIGGYPLADLANMTINLIPAGQWQKRLLAAKKAIIFLDELTTLNGAMQAAVMALIHERRAGDVVFPSSIVPIAAMNPADQAAGGFDLAAPLANRLVHLPWGVDSEAVTQGFIDEWPVGKYPKLPSDWEKHKKGVAILVASFFKKHPTLIHQLPKEESKRSEPWPSPRTWYEFAIPCMAAVQAVRAGEDIEALLLSGAVGLGTAQEFLGWRRNLDLLDPEDILKDPSSFEPYDRPDKTFATLNAVVACVVNNMTGERWVSAWKVLHKTAKAGHVALAAVACRSLVKARKGNLPNVKEYTKPFEALLEAAGI